MSSISRVAREDADELAAMLFQSGVENAWNPYGGNREAYAKGFDKINWGPPKKSLSQKAGEALALLKSKVSSGAKYVGQKLSAGGRKLKIGEALMRRKMGRVGRGAVIGGAALAGLTGGLVRYGGRRD